MKSPMCFAVVAFIFSLICFPAACSSIHAHHQDFVHCLSSKLRNNATSQVLYTPSSPSFLPILNMSAQNSRFTGPGTPKPVVIITPLRESHVRAALICSRKYNIQLRTRSGGHDYEGVSFVSSLPFAILDLIKFRSIEVNVGEKSAWVQTGATLGELYYSIANKSDTLAFPAGICPTVGTGGHISGGGYGMLLRKYGLAADHVIDARIMDVNGRILDRKSMGEDLFWAIRGGGGASFGIILAWKLELVPVPETVTVFNISKTLEQNLTNLLYKWQFFANKADRNLYLRVVLQNTNTTGERTVEGLFNAQYLGRSEALLAMMQKGFPELGVTKSDLTEMSWINTVTYHYPVDSLLNRSFNLKQRSFKIKSDYAKRPFTPQIFQGMLELFKEEDINGPNMQLVPYGGIMDEISPSETPYPHRAGNLFFLGYATGWDEVGQVAAQKHLSWIRKLYAYLTPYVSNNPRESYSNYRDFDLGQNNLVGTTSLDQASSWGYKYFMNNFYRLAKVKALVDPHNFFRNEQSVIPLSYPL
ncbi:berberine bridge enzyme-like 26 [Ipomoea triloba]|uniref:berberine bridge enzyme-like 26 n=1 Tax=Ipomoea triloba TaxID=35885 RepID=UPI00125D9F00|nr:berberine bridge enzyme-like 26 [Ipomoea triloba]